MLEGRASVFARVSDWAYVPARRGGEDHERRAAGGARARVRRARSGASSLRYVAAEDVPVEIRGAGQATRQVDQLPLARGVRGRRAAHLRRGADARRELVVYPPHKHDDTPDCSANNEEIYYFRVGRAGEAATSDEGFGVHRTYTADGSIDATVVVRDGDVFLVPRGYHGPCVASPGYPLYYLNVMAGPSPDRTMAIVDEPAHRWIRASWSEQSLDRRLPMVTAADSP